MFMVMRDAKLGEKRLADTEELLTWLPRTKITKNQTIMAQLLVALFLKVNIALTRVAV